MSNGEKRVEGIEKLNKIAARAMSDSAYRQKLINDPKTELKNEGLTGLDDVDVEIHENTDQKVHMVLPSRPGESDKLDVNETRVTHLIATVHF